MSPAGANDFLLQMLTSIREDVNKIRDRLDAMPRERRADLETLRAEIKLNLDDIDTRLGSLEEDAKERRTQWRIIVAISAFVVMGLAWLLDIFAKARSLFG